MGNPLAGVPGAFLNFFGSQPADFDPATVRFYAWTSSTRNGEVIASDYAPDTGWITATP